MDPHRKTDLIPVRPDGLQIDSDATADHRHWLIERVAWLAFVALIAAALAGFTGGSEGSRHRSVQVGPHLVDYPSIARKEASFRLIVALGGEERWHEIVLPARLTAAIPVLDVTPAPLASFTTARGLHLVVESLNGQVVIEARARLSGVVESALQVDENVVLLTVLVLP